MATEGFVQLLLSLQSKDNTLRTAGAAEFDRLTATPGPLLTALLEVASASPNETARTLASIYARTLLLRDEGRWNMLSQAEQAAAKTGLLAAMQKEGKKHIRGKLAHAIGEVAANVYTADPPQTWPELLPLVLSSAQSPDAGTRHTAMILFDKVALYIGSKVLAGHQAELIPLLASRLQDSVWQVQLESIKCFVSVVLSTKGREEKEKYAPLMMPSLTALSAVLKADEFEAKEALTSLVDIASSAPTLFRPILDAVVGGMSAICNKTDLNIPVRCMALELLTQLCHSAPGMMRKHGKGVTAGLTAALAFLRSLEDTSDGTVWLAQPLDNMEQSTDMELEEELQTQGESTLLRMCRRIGGGAVAAPIIQSVSALLRSENWVDRRAGLLALTTSLEGCEDQLRADVPALTQLVLERVSDAHPRVRHAALRCIAGLAEAFGNRQVGQLNFQAATGKQVIPILTAAMLSTSSHGKLERLRGLAADTLTSVIHFELCPREVVEAPLDILKAAVDLIKTTNGTWVKCTALGIISACAELLRTEFAGVYSEVVPLVNQLATESAAGGAKFTKTRDSSITALTHIFHGVQYSQCAADVEPVLALVVDALGASKATATGAATSRTGSSSSSTYQQMASAVARLAATMGEAFAPHVPRVLPNLVATATQHVEQYELDPSKDDMEAEELAGLSKYELPVQHHGSGSHNATWVALDENAMFEKSSAVATLFALLDHLPVASLVPYVNDMALALVPLMHNFGMESTRIASLSSAHRLMRVAMADTANPRHAQVMAETVLPALVKQVIGEGDRQVLMTGLEALTAVCRDLHEQAEAGMGRVVLGEALLTSVLNAVLAVMVGGLKVRNRLIEMLEEEDTDAEAQAQVQGVFDMEDENLTSLVDTTGYLIKTYKSALLPVLESTGVLTLFVNLSGNTVPVHATVRAGGLAFCVDVLEHCGASAAEMLAPTLPHLLEVAASSNPMLRQLGVYGLGIAVGVHAASLDGPALAKVVPALVHAAFKDPLAPTEDMQIATVNAVSGLVKLLNAGAGADVAFKAAGTSSAQVLAAVVGWLPAAEGGDEIEARQLHSWFLAQVASGNPAIVGEGGAALHTILDKVVTMVQRHWTFFFSTLAAAAVERQDNAQVDNAATISDKDLTVTIPSLATSLATRLGQGPVAAALGKLSAAQQAALRDPSTAAAAVAGVLLPHQSMGMAREIVQYCCKYPSSLVGEGQATLRLSGLLPAATAAAGAASPASPPGVFTGAGAVSPA